MPPFKPKSKPVRPKHPVTQRTIWSPEWVDKRLHVITDRNKVWVKAKVCGFVAVHPGIGSRKDRWVVAAVGSTLCIVDLPTEDEAVQVAAVLAERVNDCFSATTAKGTYEAMPEWVERWCRHMIETNGFVDPVQSGFLKE